MNCPEEEQGYQNRRNPVRAARGDARPSKPTGASCRRCLGARQSKLGIRGLPRGVFWCLKPLLRLNQMMRPEYQAAVEAVRFGWSFWIIWIIPALMIWGTLLLPTFMPRWMKIGIGVVVFGIAFVTFLCLTVFQLHRLQSTRERLAKTWREEVDVADDTGRLMAPFRAIPYGVVYCGAHQLGVAATALIWRGIAYLFCRKPNAKDGSPAPLIGTSPIDANPFTSALAPTSHPPIS